MSTPSTATMSIPQDHHYYNYKPHQYLPPINTDYHPQSPFRHQHQQQQPQQPGTPSHHATRQLPPAHYASNYTTLPAQSSSANQYPHAHEPRYQDPRQQQPAAPATNAHTQEPASSPHAASDQPQSSKKRQRNSRVDWNHYFSKGLPSEIIVIEDSDDEESKRRSQQHQPDHYSVQARYEPPLDPAHADKRQKLASTANNYNPVYHQHQQQSTASTPQYAHSPSQLAYSDHTPHQNTTAPTSLGSNSSGALPYEPVPGQKRKRTTKQPQPPRHETRLRDPYADYRPPPNPPYKAAEVAVPIITDGVSRNRHQNSQSQVKPPYDDDDGHYIVKEQTELTERYWMESLLGQGTFGRVVKAFDRDRKRWVAIKIIRAVQKYREASKIELRVLATLAHNDKFNHNKCIHLRDTFDYRDHICIVTDLLGQSVFDFLKNNQYVPFPSSHIQSFARQLFTSVAFLHDLNLIHTDLKPENILLVNNNYQTFTYNRNIPSSSSLTNRTAKYRRVLLDPEIRLIDFGSATFDDEYHSSVVSTRHYRAPEIYLNLGWSFPCDIWSIGCILVEFFTGDALFQTHEDLEHLAMMEAVCGKEVDRTIVRAVTAGRTNKNAAAAFFKKQVLDYPRAETPKQSRKFVKAMKQFDEFIPAHTSSFNQQFLDLLRKIFVYDPRRRITAKQALQHPWFQEHYEDDGTEAARIRIERMRQDAAKARTEQQHQKQQPPPPPPPHQKAA